MLNANWTLAVILAHAVSDSLHEYQVKRYALPGDEELAGFTTRIRHFNLKTGEKCAKLRTARLMKTGSGKS